MAPLRQEILKTGAAAAVVALHCLGGDHAFIPSSTVAVTVCLAQLFSLFLAVASGHARQTAEVRALKKTSAAACEPADEEPPVPASTTHAAHAAPLAGVVAAVATSRKLWIPAGALLMAGAARLLYSSGILSAPALMVLAFLSGGIARWVLLATSREDEGECCGLCTCGQRCGGAGEVCPYSADFWADLTDEQEPPEE
eukprot:CAMPEP_0197896590 /NCGR_PEP_ID=MMETSP1439-20131203/40273_1 /TAXON_ID=66791 /ORGANISM="Gonyaulax spinifera, Strain CCMP409" /LENGTH=197 /DNA_ID=CAMNT_0043517133 /DNA_START=79 /DNA_END=672 /DNA_ORIENTATION=+